MIQIKRKKDCCGCRACAQICPRDCITMQEDAEGFLYPKMEENLCIQCGLCETVCPVWNRVETQKKSPKTYAAYNLDERVRLNSSSGGIFTLLAEEALARKGVVYGAAMDGSYVRHIRVTEHEMLPLLQGSKYVQSDIGNCFALAEQDLKKGKTVLFTGTPCQIEGLKAFLRQEYESLICMDIICHGVPSPMVWQKYVSCRETAAGAKMESMSFRRKENGWKSCEVMFRFVNGKTYVCEVGKEPFMRVFLHDLCLRPSCYQCKFKNLHRVSDLTVADFWGIEEVCPEMDDNKGTSLLIVHSERGESILEKLGSQVCCQEVELEAALRGNAAMLTSATKPEKRDDFMAQIQPENFEQLVLRYAKNPLTAKSLVKKMLQKLGLWGVAQRLKKFPAFDKLFDKSNHL